MRTILPTLSWPPNSRSLVSASRTTTGSGPSSARLSQPEPYLKGTSNMGKKSEKHIRVRTFRGRPMSLLGKSRRFDLNIPLWRTGMSDFMISTMSR